MAYIKKINGYALKDEEARQIITDIKEGNVTVGKALKDANGNVIADTYATQSALNTVSTTASSAKSTAESAYALAQGKNNARVFNTFEDMVEGLRQYMDAEYDTYFQVGSQLLIKDPNVPDYWVTEITREAVGDDLDDQTKDEINYDSTNNWGVRGTPDSNGKYPEYCIGMRWISILETSKVDLSEYVTNDTVDDIISGDMQVGSAKTAGSATKATQDADGNIISSTYAKMTGTYTNMVVGKATNADNATKATQDADGNVISSTYAKSTFVASTYASKSELQAEKITFHYDTSDEELIIKKNTVKITPTVQA